MLVLSRKNQEEILINDNITIKIVRLEGKRVRIGICAPINTKIFRKEKCAAIKTERANRGKRIATAKQRRRCQYGFCRTVCLSQTPG